MPYLLIVPSFLAQFLIALNIVRFERVSVSFCGTSIAALSILRCSNKLILFIDNNASYSYIFTFKQLQYIKLTLALVQESPVSPKLQMPIVPLFDNNKMITGASNDQITKDWKDAKQYRQSSQLDKYLFSDEFFSLFKKLLKYDLDTLLSLSSAEAKQLCAKELRRLQSIRQKTKIPPQFLVDNELATIIMQNQMRGLLELQRVNEENLKKFGSPAKKRVSHEVEESRDNIVVRRYEGIYTEIQRNQEQIRYFMEAEVINNNQVDFALCQKFFKKQASKLKRSSNQKMIISRADLLEAISYFLGEANKALHPQGNHKVPEDGEGSEEEEENNKREDVPSYEQVNKWRRLASRFIEQKLVQLSGVCQQIPQLQAFNRTLQFSQLESRQKVIFLKIVDVLISLHHRVSYLSRNKPQLMRELEHAQQQLICLHNGCSHFLTRLQDQQTQIVQITFASEVKKHNQLSDYFLQVRKHIIRLCEIIMSQDQYHSQLLSRTDRLVHIIIIFTKAFMGNHQSLEEWEQYINGGIHEHQQGGFSQDEYQLLLQLQQCMLEHHNKLISMQNGEQQSTTRTNQELEDEVNKLISDYQRLKQENRQLLQSLEMLSKVKEDLEFQVEERDNMIYNLSGLKLTLEKKLANQEGASNHSQHNFGEQLKKQQHQTQKYLESSLLLREQLKVSQNEREKLLQLMEFQKEKHTKQLELFSRNKIEKESLQTEKQQLNERIDKMRNDHQRQINKLNKQINDLTNDKELMQMQQQRAVSNNDKLMERLDISERKLKEQMKNNQNEDIENRRSDREYKYELQSEKYHNQADRYRKEAERAKRDLDSKKIQNEQLEKENNDFRQEVTALKAKIKQFRSSEDNVAEKEEAFREMKSKLEKANTKIAALSKESNELREEEEQLSNKLKYATKRVKDLEAKMSQIEVENGRMGLEIQHKNNQNIDLQKSIASQANQLNTQIRYLKDLSDKQGQQIKQKQSKLQSLQSKIARLQQQLSRRGAQNQQKTKEIADLKFKKYETIIEEEKITRIKLEESNRQLSNKLNEKIEVEVKLNFEIGRLCKEIDRLKQMLQKYIRELTEKELIIKFQKQQNQKQLRILDQIKMKQRIRQQNQGTPSRPISSDPSKRSGDFDTPSQFDNLSKSNIKYDIYFNAKEYERLQSEYHQYRQSASHRIEELERIVQDIRKSKVELEVKYTNLQIENKKIINSRAFNGSTPQTQGEDRKKLEALQAKLKEAYQTIDNLGKQQTQSTPDRTPSQQIQKARVLLQEKESTIKRLEKKILQLVSDLERTKTIGQERESFTREKQALESQIQQLRNRLAINNTQASQTSSSDLQRRIQALQEDINRRQSQKNKTEDSKKQLLGERDLIRKQYDELRRHLQEETKRKVNIQSQLLQARQEIKKMQIGSNEQAALKKQIQLLEIQLETLRIELKAERERSKQDRLPSNNTNNSSANNGLDISYYLEKIKSLEEALVAVGDEYNDSKQALSNARRNSSPPSPAQSNQQMIQDIQKLQGERQYLAYINLQQSDQIQILRRRQTQLNAKECIYIRELESMSREIVNLKDIISKPSEKNIITNLPQKNNPVNVNYQQFESDMRKKNYEGVLREMEVLIEGRGRWEGTRLLQSLQRWRVPLIIVKEIEELLAYVSQIVDFLKFIREDYLHQNQNPKDLLLENLLEFVFRILVYFSDISTSSPEAQHLRAQILQISKRYSGGVFFTAVEQFTIHILENNAIQQYKRQLRAKAKELLQIKEKLDELITRQIEQEEKMVNRPHSHRERDTTPYRQSLNASPKPIR